jgi:hypothetical protein
VFTSEGTRVAIWANKKGRQFPGGLLVNAGNHLRSYTLTGKLFKGEEGVASAKAQNQSGDSFPER